ncbi:glutathione synthase/RimK-type ligase-like ATP-grasp enzyme [Desulfitispora alkaliphila]|uniref:YheC/YheD family endospore coat-associated protein n=1 Tax=Desulfitispora alkaliphila TaxID=622674 RepID=UPI003D25CB33
MSNLYTLNIYIKGSEKKQLILNKYQMDVFAFDLGQRITLRVGFDELNVEVVEVSDDSQNNNLYLSKSAFSDLTHYHGGPLWLAFLSKDKVILGPTLGLTVYKRTLKRIGEVQRIEKQAKLALEKGILLYCFSLRSVDWASNRVYAHYLCPRKNKWKSKQIPVPQVIYDRGSNPSSKNVEGYINRGKVDNIQWINTTRTFNKWDTYQAIKKFEETAEFMPNTELLTLTNLKKFMRKYETCYIKHNYSYFGRKVFRIETSGRWYLLKTGGSVIKSWKFTSLKALYSFLHKNIGRDLIIQQQIYLAKRGEAPFDMRILVQKNSIGKWTVSGVNFRIAKPGAIVTNFAAGSKDIFIRPGDSLIHPKLSWENLEEFTFKAAHAMENHMGSLGEIGFDVALDREGKLWVIEANSRPNYAAYREAPEDVYKQILGLPLDYAKYLVKMRYDGQ